MANPKSSITLIQDVDRKLFSLKNIKTRKNNGTRFVPVHYKNKIGYFQLPIMLTPFGVSEYQHEESSPIRYSLSLSFRGMDEDDNMALFGDFLSKFSEDLIYEGTQHPEWFPKILHEDLTVERVTNGWFHPLRITVKNGIVQDYPPTVRIKLPEEIQAFIDNEPKVLTPENYHEFIQKGSRVSVIVQLMPIWFQGNDKFGITFRAKQIAIYPRIREFNNESLFK